MPIAEAISCGTDVICSDTPETREAALQKGIFLTQQEIQQKLPAFFLKQPYSPKKNERECNYPSNREKAQRIIDIISSIKLLIGSK